MATYNVSTPYGQISVWDSKSEGPVALLLHGNSACKDVFKYQFESDLGKKFRLIAMDLPGHGQSENAKNPEETYSLPGYADVAIAVINKLGIRRATVVGWSLGGHIAIDMLKRSRILQGILITGTPPIPLTEGGFKQGFRPFPCLHLMSQEKFSQEEAETFVSQGGIDPKKADFMIQAALRTDGKARSLMIASMQKGVGGDQKQVVEESQKPIAIVAGSKDAGINNEYIVNKVNAKTLWQKKVHFVEGGHAVFWENPKHFNALLSDFLSYTNQSAELEALQQAFENTDDFELKSSLQARIGLLKNSLLKLEEERKEDQSRPQSFEKYKTYQWIEEAVEDEVNAVASLQIAGCGREAYAYEQNESKNHYVFPHICRSAYAIIKAIMASSAKDQTSCQCTFSKESPAWFRTSVLEKLFDKGLGIKVHCLGDPSDDEFKYDDKSLWHFSWDKNNPFLAWWKKEGESFIETYSKVVKKEHTSLVVLKK